MVTGDLSLANRFGPDHEFFFRQRYSLFRHRMCFFVTIFFPLFLNEGGRIKKNRLSKLHYRFQRYTSLIKSVYLESQCLLSYDGVLDFFRPNFEVLHHNSIGIEIQDKRS